MQNVLEFKKIINKNIFSEDFIDFNENNLLNFQKANKQISVLYAPNGTGKSSLTRVLNEDDETEYEATFNSVPKEKLFLIINDQNSRNIIKGESKDFFLGDNIEKEFNLKKNIDNDFEILREKVLVDFLKNQFNIKTKTNKLIEQISSDKLLKYVPDIAFNRSKGKDIDINEFVEYLSSKEIETVPEYSSDKINFLCNNFEKKSSLMHVLNSLNADELNKVENIEDLEKHNSAITILEKFDTESCIVCDNPNYCKEDLHTKKTSEKEKIYNNLDKKTQSIITEILDLQIDNDVYEIKRIIQETIKTGDKNILNTLLDDITENIRIFNILLLNGFISKLQETSISENLMQYNELLETQLVVNQSDLLFMESVVNANVDNKKIELLREDETKKIKIKINKQDILEVDRVDIPLSSGEQNFISLIFEFLKAKKSDKEFIVIDDPISSFDSIYKNKIAYSILKTLNGKKKIILTHNTDLIRLLEHQLKGCFNLYLFNNQQNAENGFIKVNDFELKLLLEINQLLKLFRNKIKNHIINEKLFLISLIPFMRAYSNIIGNKHKYKLLSKIMHGYEKSTIDISHIYKVLFLKKNNFLNTKTKVSVIDIINLDLENIEILKQDRYFLLNKTLKHSLIYLVMRLTVEKALIDNYDITISGNMTLGEIISESLSDDDESLKIFFASKKTLLNEFNHFEGNMNIFQPAIDINDTILAKEVNQIIEKIENITNN